MDHLAESGIWEALSKGRREKEMRGDWQHGGLGGGLSHEVRVRSLGSERCRGAHVTDLELHVGE